MQAISFLCDGSSSGDLRCKYANKEDDGGFICEFVDQDVPDVLAFFASENHQKVLQEQVIDDSKIRERRCFKTSKKVESITEKASFNDEGKNNTGIDTTIKNCFDLNIVGASDDPQELAGYGTKSLVKKLLEDIFKNASEAEDYNEFVQAFDKFFRNPDSSLRQQMGKVESSLSDNLSTFFGRGSVTFDIPCPDVGNIVKNLGVSVDTGIKLTLENHGNGLQRMVAFSLLCVWAETQSSNKNLIKTKPYAFILDEPEVCMNPRAQESLLKALLQISKDHQVFVSTHSPLFLHDSKINNVNLLLCSKIARTNIVAKINNIKLFDWGPTWGEISWFAYKLPTKEFHDELWSELIVQLKNMGYPIKYEIDVDKWLLDNAKVYLNGCVPISNWTKSGAKQNNGRHSLYYCIRNAIHHPENELSQPAKLINDGLNESISGLCKIVMGIKNIK